jgi:hypothetical protein
VRRHYDSFDRNQFENRRLRAVSKESGIAYTDFDRMHVLRRETHGDRHTLLPEWSQDDLKMREVVLRFLESRFYINNHEGTNEERLARVQDRALAYLPMAESSLKNMLTEYNEAACSGASSTDLGKRSIQIQNLDAQICMIRRGIAGVVSSFAYYHFRLLDNSVQVAEKLGVKPPMVRIWAHRMQLIAREVFDGVKRPAKPPTPGEQRKRDRRRAELTERIAIARGPKPKRGSKYKAAIEMAQAGRTTKEIASHFGVRYQSIRSFLLNRGIRATRQRAHYKRRNSNGI